MAVVATNPGTLLGVGTWVAFGQGRMLVGLDSGDTDYDTVEETGGAKTVTLITSQMPSHSHTQDSHSHTQDSHNHTQDSHNHTVIDHYHWVNAHTHSITGGWSHFLVNNNIAAVALGSGGSGRLIAQANAGMDAASPGTGGMQGGGNNAATATNQAATATNQSTVATNQNTGGGGSHPNVPPYIVVYMWKRTA